MEMVDDHFRHDAPLARVAGEVMGVRAEPCRSSLIAAKFSRLRRGGANSTTSFRPHGSFHVASLSTWIFPGLRLNACAIIDSMTIDYQEESWRI
jgi:hypothetical protein